MPTHTTYGQKTAKPTNSFSIDRLPTHASLSPTETSHSPLSLSGMQDASTLMLPSDVGGDAGRDDACRDDARRDDARRVATYPAAADATNMQHVRTAIDDLDRKIVSLLG